MLMTIIWIPRDTGQSLYVPIHCLLFNQHNILGRPLFDRWRKLEYVEEHTMNIGEKNPHKISRHIMHS